MLDLAIAATITSLEFSSFGIHKVIRSCTNAYLDIGQPLGGVIDFTKPVNTRQSVYTWNFYWYKPEDPNGTYILQKSCSINSYKI